jgi:hypothetical protein
MLPVLSSSHPPTFLALTEVNGSPTDFCSARCVTSDVSPTMPTSYSWWAMDFHHCHSLSDAGIHADVTAALAGGADTSLRRCMRALLSLVCYLGGMRGSHPAVWSWDHLAAVIGRRDGTNRTVAASRWRRGRYRRVRWSSLRPWDTARTAWRVLLHGRRRLRTRGSAGVAKVTEGLVQSGHACVHVWLRRRSCARR